MLILGVTACEPIDPTEPVSTAEGYAIAYVIDGDTIEVTDSHADTEDLYGRLLRYVETADGTDVGASLIAAGYAYAWTPDSAPEPQRYDDYQDSTDAARIAEAGAWNTCPSLGQSR